MALLPTSVGYFLRESENPQWGSDTYSFKDLTPTPPPQNHSSVKGQVTVKWCSSFKLGSGDRTEKRSWRPQSHQNGAAASHLQPSPALCCVSWAWQGGIDPADSFQGRCHLPEWLIDNVPSLLSCFSEAITSHLWLWHMFGIRKVASASVALNVL